MTSSAKAWVWVSFIPIGIVGRRVSAHPTKMHHWAAQHRDFTEAVRRTILRRIIKIHLL